MKTIEVVAAIIEFEGKLFCAQRNENKKEYLSYKFEFPGGKTEEGETREEALIREIKEELNWEITIDKFFMTVHHTYPDFNLIMHSYLCSTTTLDFQLNEHASFKWLAISDLNTLDWAAADIPIVDKLIASY
ncbi:(deoxy)nucleoside triphosphate pyrophosphohydrolase [Myroides sp. DF42-4-2]|uniref:(deoxy)nucleoside triphosphate pyrophosphohydrolase n=1 Tax=unclassified Myroides TaxID=2642485 RepID=UPI002575859E|nr:(deoxy)nucleoside triphosphate pyrophosphohydrolase [Myroides sp. DF42-4-2]MDM1407037.1 (deoxy)nucleoside triphosphate pyrophosphohydrolase [Myroides sp. DF42-4-2]